MEMEMGAATARVIKEEKLYHLNNFGLFPELHLIVACLRISPNEMEVQQIKQLSETKIDWHNFLVLVDRHRVAPLVYSNLSRYARKAMPDSIMNQLHSRFERNAHRSLVNVMELVRLYKLFQENGIPVLPLKGSLLALQVYGNLALRHAGDIDLLIDQNNLELADRLLQAIYQRTRPVFLLNPQSQYQFYRLWHHFEYFCNRIRIRTELHWHPMVEHPAMDFAWLQSNVQYLSVAGVQLPVLSVDDNILYLCGHGSKHSWQRLFWLVDLAEITKQYLDIDWDRLLMIAVKLGLKRPLAQGIILAHIFLDAPLPDAIRAYAERDSVVTYLTKAAFRRIAGPYSETLPLLQILPHKIYLLRLCSNTKDRFRSLQRILAFASNWNSILLPNFLFPLYMVSRPFIKVHRLLRGRREQVRQH